MENRVCIVIVTDVFCLEDFLITSIGFVIVFHGKSPQFYSLLRQLVIIISNKTNNLAVKPFTLQHRRLTNWCICYLYFTIPEIIRTALHDLYNSAVSCREPLVKTTEREVKLNSSSVRCHLISHQFMVMPRATERVCSLFIQLHFIQFTEDIRYVFELTKNLNSRRWFISSGYKPVEWPSLLKGFDLSWWQYNFGGLKAKNCTWSSANQGLIHLQWRFR